MTRVQWIYPATALLLAGPTQAAAAELTRDVALTPDAWISTDSIRFVR
jgi:hypothetical protein